MFRFLDRVSLFFILISVKGLLLHRFNIYLNKKFFLLSLEMSFEILNFIFIALLLVFISLLNTILAGCLIGSSRQNLLYRYHFYWWLSSLFSLVAQGISWFFPAMTCLLFLLTLAGNFFLCRLIHPLVGLSYLNEKKYAVKMVAALLMAIVLYQLRDGFKPAAMLISLVLMTPGIRVFKTIFAQGVFKDLSLALKAYLILATVFMAHQLILPWICCNLYLAKVAFLWAACLALSVGLVFIVVAVESVQTSMRDQMAKMSENFARVSHDLKNPLILISAQLTQLTREKDPEALRSRVADLSRRHQIRSAAVMDMMKDLSLLSGLEAVKKASPVALKAAWSGACERVLGMQPVLNFKGFKAHYTGLELTVLMSRSDLERIFENVIKNAAEAMHEVGEIRVEVARLPNQRAEIVILNTASIVSAGVLEKLQSHVQTSTKSKGSGLGLQVVSHLVAKYDGKVAIDYERGEFSVAFDLPLV